MVKKDGTPAKVDEKLPFKVIEFSKAAKRIILSHTKVNEDEAKEKDMEIQKSKTLPNTQKTIKKIKTNIERTTLGDISELASLKVEMEENSKDSKKKKRSTKDSEKDDNDNDV